MDFDCTYERLTPELELCVSPQHKFGTDAFLLADFAAPRRSDRVCDLGTGCGIIPFLWMRGGRPRQVYALDIQRQAIAQLERSVERCGLQGTILPMQEDLRALPRLKERIGAGVLELVTCNPPYKAQQTGILSEEEAGQIARHEVCCTVGDVCAAAALLLKYGGRLCVCQRPERLPDVFEAMRRHSLEPKRLRLVQQRPDTPPWLFLAEARLGGRPHLRIEPPLIVEGEGGFSPEVLKIYGKAHNKERRDER